MSCLIAPLPGGSPEIFPHPVEQFYKMQAHGRAAAQALGVPASAIDEREFLGAARRTDGTPFYLWICAPDLAEGESKPWQGAFFAPFGVGDLCGALDVTPGQEKDDSFAITEVKVRAELQLRGSEHVSASWSLIGSQLTVANKAALISDVVVKNAGPHSAEDMRRCIALHAPQRALGEPRALVSMQCGVAAACMLEAIC